MKKEQLNDINKEIYEVFANHGIEEHEMLNVYRNCLNDFEMNFHIYFQIEDKYFNMLRDIVWYNFEYSDTRDISDWGSKYKKFMFLFEDSDEISSEDAQAILNELNDIKKKLDSSEVYVTALVGDQKLFENPKLKVDFIDKRKDKKLKKEKVSSKNIICYVSEDLNRYQMEKIKLHAVIDNFMEALKKSIANNVKITAVFI